MNFFFLLSLLLFSFVASGSAESAAAPFISEARVKKLARHPQWLRLLHYRKTWFGEKSEIDDRSFFLSKNGRRDPQDELDKTIAAFFEPLPTDAEAEPAQCRYAARFEWLNSQLNFPSELNVVCTRYESWKEKLNPTGVSLVFASYYMNNPASLYGHTFLTLHRQGVDRDSSLLDYTVNFAAQTNTKNGLVFAAKGLFGGYRGVFSTHPYYMKVQQYNNLEARDLWEYKLNLTPEAINRLLLHLWELGHTSMAYYFFNRNCSYQLLPLLEVADSSINVSRPFHFRAIPLDTLRAVLNQPTLIGERRYRPSHMSKMLTARNRLSKDEIELAEDLGTKSFEPAEAQLKKLPIERQSLVLDSAYDYWRYKWGFRRGLPEEAVSRERQLLLVRQPLPKSPPIDEASVRTTEPPESAHRTVRVSAGFGAYRTTTFEEVSIRSSLHDLEDNQSGFTSGSQLEMFHIRARYDDDRDKGHLEEFTMIEVKSFTPRDRWVKPKSWRLKTGFNVARDLDREPEDSLVYGLGGGSGWTFNIPKLKDGLIYGLIEGDAAVGGILDDNYRAGLGGSAGVAIGVTPWWRTHFTAGFIRYPIGNVGNANKLKWANSFGWNKNRAIRINLDRQNHSQEAMAAVYFYF